MDFTHSSHLLGVVAASARMNTPAIDDFMRFVVTLYPNGATALDVGQASILVHMTGDRTKALRLTDNSSADND